MLARLQFKNPYVHDIFLSLRTLNLNYFTFNFPNYFPNYINSPLNSRWKIGWFWLEVSEASVRVGDLQVFLVSLLESSVTHRQAVFHLQLFSPSARQICDLERRLLGLCDESGLFSSHLHWTECRPCWPPCSRVSPHAWCWLCSELEIFVYKNLRNSYIYGNLLLAISIHIKIK